MTKLGVLRRKLGSFWRSSGLVRLWFVPIWLMLGIGRLLVLLLPFRHLAAWLGQYTGISPWVPMLSRAQTARALQISRVVRMAARYTPWESNCFPQAITASLMLRCYGVPYMVFFGLTHGENHKMQAHAWVAAGQIEVTGGTSFGVFTVVGCFNWSGRPISLRLTGN